jgi:hypothetical protein
MPYQMQQALGALVVPLLALLAVVVALGKPKGKPTGRYAASIVYFACLGAGFIAVELTLLQNLTLLLGHPIFTLSILLFTILAFGGLGSALSGRVQCTSRVLSSLSLIVAHSLCPVSSRQYCL